MQTILSFFLAASGSSFIHCLLFRIDGKRPLKGKSYCPVCAAKLSVGEIIPCFSYLLQRGKCRNCGAKMESYSFFCEIFAGIIGVSLAMRYTGGALFFRWLLFILADALAYGDYLSYTVYSPLHYLWFVLEIAAGQPVKIVGGFWFTLPFFLLKISRPQSIGGGDIEYFFLLSSLYGGTRASVEICLACLTALLYCRHQRKKNGHLAMMPFFLFIHWCLRLFL